MNCCKRYLLVGFEGLNRQVNFTLYTTIGISILLLFCETHNTNASQNLQGLPLSFSQSLHPNNFFAQYSRSSCVSFSCIPTSALYNQFCTWFVRCIRVVPDAIGIDDGEHNSNQSVRHYCFNSTREHRTSPGAKIDRLTWRLSRLKKRSIHRL